VGGAAAAAGDGLFNNFHLQRSLSQKFRWRKGVEKWRTQVLTVDHQHHRTFLI